MRLQAVTDFDLCEPVFFKPKSLSPTVPATFIIRKGMNTSFIQPEYSNKTRLVSDHIARLESVDIQIEPTDQKSTYSESENSRDNIDVTLPNSNEKTLVTEGE